MAQFEQFTDQEWWAGPSAGMRRAIQSLILRRQVQVDYPGVMAESVMMASAAEQQPRHLQSVTQEIGRQLTEQHVTIGYDVGPPDNGGGEFAKLLPFHNPPGADGIARDIEPSLAA